MASTAQVVIEILHVVGAIALVGYLAVMPMWKAAATRSGDAALVRHFLATARQTEMRLVVPALALVFLTGLLLSVGPYALVELARVRWAQASLALTIVIGILVVIGLGGPTKKMLALAEAGETSGPAMDKLWGEWRTALGAASLLALVAVALMVYQGSL